MSGLEPNQHEGAAFPWTDFANFKAKAISEAKGRMFISGVEPCPERASLGKLRYEKARELLTGGKTPHAARTLSLFFVRDGKRGEKSPWMVLTIGLEPGSVNHSLRTKASLPPAFCMTRELKMVLTDQHLESI